MSNNVNYKIYKLIDPRNDKIRYIGLTFNTLKQRLRSHRNEKGKSHKCNWINKLKLEGYEPIIELIEEDINTYEIACEKECYYIKKYKNEGHDLTNMATGGNKNKKMSLETRMKMSESSKEWHRNNKLILSKETKKILSEKAIKRFKDTKERERLSISNKKYEDSKTKEQKINDILIQKCTPVIQYTKNMKFVKEYLSINQAAKHNNLDNGNISKCCKGIAKSSGGYIWKYKNNL